VKPHGVQHLHLFPANEVKKGYRIAEPSDMQLRHVSVRPADSVHAAHSATRAVRTEAYIERAPFVLRERAQWCAHYTTHRSAHGALCTAVWRRVHSAAGFSSHIRRCTAQRKHGQRAFACDRNREAHHSAGQSTLSIRFTYVTCSFRAFFWSVHSDLGQQQLWTPVVGL
jgi:hypothetical protein